jgi:hypothetical protein
MTYNIDALYKLLSMHSITYSIEHIQYHSLFHYQSIEITKNKSTNHQDEKILSGTRVAVPTLCGNPLAVKAAFAGLEFTALQGRVQSFRITLWRPYEQLLTVIESPSIINLIQSNYLLPSRQFLTFNNIHTIIYKNNISTCFPRTTKINRSFIMYSKSTNWSYILHAITYSTTSQLKRIQGSKQSICNNDAHQKSDNNQRTEMLSRTLSSACTISGNTVAVGATIAGLAFWQRGEACNQKESRCGNHTPEQVLYTIEDT